MNPSLPRGNAVVAQSGGPTSVINQSLVGVVEALRGHPSIGSILGARHGVRGMVDESFVDFSSVSHHHLELLAATPSAALGSSRDKPDAAYCERILAALKKRGVSYFFYIGGNDSSDTCRIVSEMAASTSYELRCFHVPKTVDNDLMMSDHTPGFASAARYVALAMAGINLDNASLPGIMIDVVMGRHAGFLTGASALLREREDDGPHLVYLPEVPFDMDRVVADVDAVYRKYKRCHIAVSEGVQDKSGTPLLALLAPAEERDAHGNIRLSGTGALGDSLASTLQQKLTPAGGKAPRTRADTLGYPQRCWPEQSPVDAHEARAVARFAARTALQGALNGSIAIQRFAGPGSPRPDQPYAVEFKRVELKEVAAKTRHLPAEFIDGTRGVTQAYRDWLRPLVGP
ncbi:MAG: diphosphate--fructose-6-phosphate 1-phosphotransferase, partial [Planctomycetota bacterium]|nr:diphosphate--fructose-6-phosphate 1-phosphotransferase [Planctomycetota bacterium]